MYSKGSFSKLNYNDLLLVDLAEKINKVTDKNDNILILEIQGQYSLSGNCYSMDGIVGNQIIDVIKGEMGFEDFFRKYKIKYIVTNSDFIKRKIFLRTALPKLYYHDITSKIGDSTVINSVVYKKILTNPKFEKTENYHLSRDETSGNNIRIFSEWILWNSVYQIE